MTVEALSKQIRRSLRQSRFVEIDGLGVFEQDESGNISFHHAFQHSRKARIFISYAREDGASADRLFSELTSRGFAAWLDNHNLLPGQNWQQRIEDAIASADFVIACFSTHSVKKRGGFQVEIRHALHFADSRPLDEVYFIPVRLDKCQVPLRIQRETQYVDLFPDWDSGFERIIEILETPKPAAA
jgi:hypothetical protein